MPIDYKKELESASKGMIMIHDPNMLIKLIVRMIVTKISIRHAGVILYDQANSNYVLNISRGERGVKIPVGYARFSKNNPIIQIFSNKDFKSLIADRNGIIANEITKMIWKETVISDISGAKELLHNVEDQMNMLDIEACVPAYYQDRLLAVLLLGRKKDDCDFEQEELNFISALASDAAMAIRNAQLFTDLKKEAERNKNLFIQTTIVLASAIEAKDKYTHGHIERVTNLSLMIARQMVKNETGQFPRSFFENLYIAGLLHDIGKIGIPESILNKKEGLSEEEFEKMKKHTITGADMLKPLSSFHDCLDGVKYHHERYDGRGYPFQLKGEQIPIIACIIAVADTYDAMVTNRPYRNAMQKKDAIEEIKRNSGIQFHPLPAQALIELHEQGRLN